ncbi:competence protein [Nonlabens spongiae]|uniref:Competence protein n=1 Tax=Nonlabens spongiae TaxID=331648 RepID=A0A1W6MMJ0_9FLAO|nr:ComEC/Rec2 family competence protein [Nonlabens spongiae]ARN78797.1 competence protein [Nonlabens spongiae]
MSYPFYRILFLFIAGIIAARFNVIQFEFAQISIGIFLLIILISRFLKPLWVKKYVYGGSVLAFFFGLGSFLSYRAQQLPEHHFTNQDVIGEEHLIKFKLTDRLTPNEFNSRFYADVKEINGKLSTGRILVLFKRADSVSYNVGQELLVYDDINDASDARNPGDFNYKEYLASIDVYGQLYVDLPNVFEVVNSTSENLGFLDRLRENILNELAQSGLHLEPRSMIEALVLGQRQNIDPEITKSFRDAGVIHILALSGLHVGIILLILRWLTRPVLRLKNGNWIQSGIVVFLLWCFAMMTGLSPSIFRAVTMFSFVAVGMNINRKASVFHSLTLSAFVLLFVDTRLLFQVGFQLSYMAVYSIVLFQPILARVWPWRNKIKDFFWNILTVTLAAQIGVAPLSVFYFHQLPGLFLVGNMVLLPSLPFIIGAALLLIVLLLVNAPSSWLVSALNNALEWIISFVGNISSYDTFIFKDLYVELYELILLYIIIIGIALYLRPYVKRSRRQIITWMRPNWMLHVSLTALVVLITIGIIIDTTYNENKVLLLHQARGSAISLSNNEHAHLLVDLSKMDSLRAQTSLERLINISPHRDRQLDTLHLKNEFSFKEVYLIRIDSTGVWHAAPKNQLVLLSHSPKINLERLIEELKPKAIISDGSNYRSSVEQWKATCDENGVPFFNTYEEGAIDLRALAATSLVLPQHQP